MTKARLEEITNSIVHAEHIEDIDASQEELLEICRRAKHDLVQEIAASHTFKDTNPGRSGFGSMGMDDPNEGCD